MRACNVAIPDHPSACSAGVEACMRPVGRVRSQIQVSLGVLLLRRRTLVRGEAFPIASLGDGAQDGESSA